MISKSLINAYFKALLLGEIEDDIQVNIADKGKPSVFIPSKEYVERRDRGEFV